jgi:hypothetical protein
MGSDELFLTIERQNEAIIGLLARLVWKPEEIADLASRGKRNPSAYRKVYNSLDGKKSGKALASQAGVTPAAISYILQSWVEQGIVLTVGPQSQPKYKRLMAIPVREKKGAPATNGK